MTNHSSDNQDQLPNIGGRFHGAIDLSTIGNSNYDQELESDQDLDAVKLSVSEARALLDTQRSNAIQNRHLPIAPRVLFTKEPPVAEFNQQSQDEYLESLIELRIAQIGEGTNAYDNKSLIGFIDEEHELFKEEWLESSHTSEEDDTHKNRRHKSLGFHAVANTAGAALTGLIAHSAGANSLSTAVITIGAGLTASLTKDAAMRKDEFPTIHDLGDRGIAHEGSSNNINKHGTFHNKASEKEKNRSIQSDIMKNLKSFGLSDNAQPTRENIRLATEKLLTQLNQLEADKPDKALYRPGIIEIGNDIMSFTTISEPTEENLVRLRVRTAVKLHSLEIEMHDSKKFNKWKIKKRLASFALAGAVGIGATIPFAMAHAENERDNDRQEQIQKEQNTPQKPTADIQDPGTLTDQEQKSIEDEFNDSLGN